MYAECSFDELLHTYSDNSILIITATDIETIALHKSMSPLLGYNKLLKTYHGANTYYCGILGKYSVVSVQTARMGALQQGSVSHVVIDAVRDWEPRSVIMIGIAFGRNKTTQKIGDVMISESIASYEPARIGETHAPRGHILTPSDILFDRFGNSKLVKPYNYYKCQLVSGEKLIDAKNYKEELFRTYPYAKGGEMEGAGLASTCARLNTPWILVKSICDWADGKKNDKYQIIASNNAADYCRTIFENEHVFTDLGIHPSELIDTKHIQCLPEDSGIIAHRPSGYDKLMSFRIVSLKHKNIIPTNQIRFTDSSKRIHYEYIPVEVFMDKTCGYILFGGNISISASVRHFMNNCKMPDIGLTVCSPRIVHETTKNENFRIDNIRNALDEIDSIKTLSKDYYFVDEFIWKNCFNGNPPEQLNNQILEPSLYIDQKLYDKHGKHVNKLRSSANHILNTIKVNSFDDKHNPVTVILGDGGSGKSTLVEMLVHKVNQLANRKAIFISSTDLHSVDTDFEVKSVTDLYELYCQEVSTDLKRHLDPVGLELNLSCGNIALIIDGLDEIESVLKERFSLESFLNSIIELNKSYNNCNVIVTSRLYHLQRYFEENEVEILCLKGFDRVSAVKYSQARIGNEKSITALKYIDTFRSGDSFNPLFLSLICDILESDDDIDSRLPVHCAYLVDMPIDKLVEKILKRELGKQHIEYSIDQLFEIFVEICIKGNGNISKSEFDEYIRILLNSSNELSSESQVPLYVNPLFKTDATDSYVTVKYDFLIPFIKARYIRQQLINHNFEVNAFLKVLPEFYDGKGPTCNELVSICEYDDTNYIDHIKWLVTELTKFYSSSTKNHSAANTMQKSISASLHLLFKLHPKATKQERTELIKYIYNDSLKYIFIYGEFYPLDFSEVKIFDSAFFDYGAFARSIFPQDQTVFYYCNISCDNIETSFKIALNIFDESCKISDSLKFATKLHELNELESIVIVENNFKRLFKSFYTSNTFNKRTINYISRNCHLNLKFSIDKLFKVLVGEGVLEKDDKLFSISKEFMGSVKHLLTNFDPDKKMRSLIRTISKL